MCNCQRKWYCTSTKRSKWCPDCWESNLSVKLEGAEINNLKDNERGGNARLREEWLRIRRELQEASAVTLVCERRVLVPWHWEIWEENCEEMCKNVKLGLHGRKRREKGERGVDGRQWDHGQILSVCWKRIG